MSKFLSLCNLQLGAFYIESKLLLPTNAQPPTKASAQLICGHFELIKDVRGCNSAWGYKRLVLQCAYRVICAADKILPLSLNLCPDGTIVRLTSDGLTDVKVDRVYTITDLSERAQRAIHLNAVTDLIDSESFMRYFAEKKARIITYANAQAA